MTMLLPYLKDECISWEIFRLISGIGEGSVGNIFGSLREAGFGKHPTGKDAYRVCCKVFHNGTEPSSEEINFYFRLLECARSDGKLPEELSISSQKVRLLVPVEGFHFVLGCSDVPVEKRKREKFFGKPLPSEKRFTYYDHDELLRVWKEKINWPAPSIRAINQSRVQFMRHQYGLPTPSVIIKKLK